MNTSSVLVVGLQLVAWSLVSGLLFYRGLTHLSMSSTADGVGVVDRSLLNSTTTTSRNSSVVVAEEVEEEDDDERKTLGYTSGVVMLTVACLMVVVGPICLVVKTAEKCRRRDTFAKVPLAEEDRPPRYEDVMAAEEKAPRYSTLFLNTDRDSDRNAKN